MIFEPDKSELIHFTRERTANALELIIGNVTLILIESGRFLRVWLDRKLNFKAYLGAIKKKLTT